jgi:hypothetical protein
VRAIKEAMTNDKAQMPNKAQNPNDKKEVGLAFKYLDFNL